MAFEFSGFKCTGHVDNHQANDEKDDSFRIQKCCVGIGIGIGIAVGIHISISIGIGIAVWV